MPGPFPVRTSLPRVPNSSRPSFSVPLCPCGEFPRIVLCPLFPVHYPPLRPCFPPPNLPSFCPNPQESAKCLINLTLLSAARRTHHLLNHRPNPPLNDWK